MRGYGSIDSEATKATHPTRGAQPVFDAMETTHIDVNNWHQLVSGLPGHDNRASHSRCMIAYTCSAVEE